MKLSIAVICKNEGKNIDRCLKSIFNSIKLLNHTEVLVVDSFSTDDTIAIASNYPVKIIQLRENWPHSPAAGRYTAFLQSRGEYTMCIDADMEMAGGFLEKALAFMDAHPQAAGLTGIIKHTTLSTTEYECLNCERGELLPLANGQLNPKEPALLRSIPGAGVFRSSAVAAAGNFHPFLRAEEEYELCQRLRRKGYELWYLPYRITDHHGYSGNGWAEIKRRLRRGFMTGMGEMFKVSAVSGFFIENCMRLRLYLALGAYMMLAPLCLILGGFKPDVPLFWLIGFMLMVLVYSAKKRSVQRGLMLIIHNALIGIHIYIQLLFQIPVAKAYPTDPIILDLSVPQGCDIGSNK
ncbi:MAG: glycosyltransferase family 2 protein [Pseudomonadota bacterium]